MSLDHAVLLFTSGCQKISAVKIKIKFKKSHHSQRKSPTRRHCELHVFHKAHTRLTRHSEDDKQDEANFFKYHKPLFYYWLKSCFASSKFGETAPTNDFGAVRHDSIDVTEREKNVRSVRVVWPRYLSLSTKPPRWIFHILVILWVTNNFYAIWITVVLPETQKIPANASWLYLGYPFKHTAMAGIAQAGQVQKVVRKPLWSHDHLHHGVFFSAFVIVMFEFRAKISRATLTICIFIHRHKDST